jgi:1,4-alpha-glucan branching enzyme
MASWKTEKRAFEGPLEQDRDVGALTVRDDKRIAGRAGDNGGGGRSYGENDGTDAASPAAGTAPARGATPAAPIADEERRALLDGAVHDPHRLLGAHPLSEGTLVRVLRPFAETVAVLTAGGERYELASEGEGLFAAVLPLSLGDYRLEVGYGDATVTLDDPYRFLPTLGEIDLHLIGEGRHEQLWEVLGSRLRRFESPADSPFEAPTGTSFAVWAPNARGVRVVGDFNYWNGTSHPMRSMGSSGVWELFVPGVEVGARYKYEILGRDGVWRQKADPLARRCEMPPANASIVDESHFEWTDGDWLDQRAKWDPYRSPMSVYELHLASWRPGLDYRGLAEQLPDYLNELGFTHVEFLPPTEHPFGGSWGYQVSSYFAPTARLGTPDDFRFLIDALHRAGIGVIIDWVPAHFPKDAWALAEFDGTPLYEHPDPWRGEHPDWGTLVFDFGRREVRNFLVASALFWCEEMHVDGLRVDAVASMLYLDYSREEGQWHPNAYGGRENLEAVSFLQELTATVYKRVPGVTVSAEESTAWPGVTRPTDQDGLGFGFKWNMGWMHDSLGYMAEAPINRRWHHNRMTFSLVYAFTENFILPISHDEVVHGKGSLLRKMPGDRWQQLANVRAYLAFMWSHPGKQLLFSGCEFAQDAEWSEQAGLDWWLLDNPAHRGVFRVVQDLNAAYRARPALWEQDTSGNGFSWLAANDGDHNVFAFVRWAYDGRPLVCVVNFAGVPWEGYSLPLPLSTDRAQVWSEVLNTDAEQYGGSGVGNFGQVYAINEGQDGWPARAVLRLPPLGALWLEPRPIEESAAVEDAAQAEIEVVEEAEAIAGTEAVAETELIGDTIPGMRDEPVASEPGLRAEPITTEAGALEVPETIPEPAKAKRVKP